MAKLRFNITMSLDGYVAGPRQSLENPLGEGGEALHEWAVLTRSFRAAHGLEGGETGIDDDHTALWNANVGATIMGRNMFGPVRGPWGDEQWTGWWGDDPPFHTPVFVLTHYERESLEMLGGTTFHFVTEGFEAALERAAETAGGRDVSLAGGADVAQQYLRARLNRRDADSCRPDVPRRRLAAVSRTSMVSRPGTNASAWRVQARWLTTATSGRTPRGIDPRRQPRRGPATALPRRRPRP